ncbi:MAG TPA: MauE/DoxX family redox-associated membrane protein [Fibrobacteria bacterium]|jgi:uncharacterized membrane protein|nr:MauE/DoxX family redox-associated membrane protein [Fibrobacteria bacterium]
MRWKPFAALVAFSLLLGAANNFVNPNRVPWQGSPEVLPKPEGWPTMSIADGAKAGAEHAWDLLRKNPTWIAGALILLVAGYAFFHSRPASRRRWILTWLRALFGLMFLAAAWPKFSDPDGFAMMVAQYQMLPAFSVHAFSLWLPALEVTAGLALLLSPWEKEASALVGLMMLMFITALAQALLRDLGIACGCFDIKGATDAGESWFALLRDIVLLVPIAWMWRRAETRFIWKF